MLPKLSLPIKLGNDTKINKRSGRRKNGQINGTASLSLSFTFSLSSCTESHPALRVRAQLLFALLISFSVSRVSLDASGNEADDEKPDHEQTAIEELASLARNLGEACTSFIITLFVYFALFIAVSFLTDTSIFCSYSDSYPYPHSYSHSHSH